MIHCNKGRLKALRGVPTESHKKYLVSHELEKVGFGLYETCLRLRNNNYRNITGSKSRFFARFLLFLCSSNVVSTHINHQQFSDAF